MDTLTALPRRTPCVQPCCTPAPQPSAPAVDRQLLRRVLDGLKNLTDGAEPTSAPAALYAVLDQKTGAPAPRDGWYLLDFGRGHLVAAATTGQVMSLQNAVRGR